jgi:hypothetical protein
MLKTHTTIEEEIFYPAARKARIEAALLDEADIEHASAKELIAQIESGDPAGDHYDARVKVLGEYITHHVVEEHIEMFPKCRRAGMDLVALRERMQARKAELDAGETALAEEGVPMAMAASAESPGILSRISDRCSRRRTHEASLSPRSGARLRARPRARRADQRERSRDHRPGRVRLRAHPGDAARGRGRLRRQQMSRAEPPRFERRSKERSRPPRSCARSCAT